MKSLMVIFDDGFVMFKKVMKDLTNAELIRELREQGFGNVEKIIEIQ